MVEGHLRNIPVKLFQNPSISLEEDKAFFFSFQPWWPSCAKKRSILVEGHPRDIPVKLFKICLAVFGGEVVLKKKLTHRRTKAS